MYLAIKKLLRGVRVVAFMCLYCVTKHNISTLIVYYTLR